MQNTPSMVVSDSSAMPNDESVDFDFAAVETGESITDRAHDALAIAGFTAQQIRLALAFLVPVINESATGAGTSLSPNERAAIGDLLRNVLLHIENAGDQAPLEAMIHRFAFDFRTSDGESMRKAASRWGLSPEAISKRVDAIRCRHGLSASSFNRPEAVCQKHKLTNRIRR